MGDGVRANLAEGNTEMVLVVIDLLPVEPAEEGEAQQKSGHLAAPVIDVCGNKCVLIFLKLKNVLS